MSSIIDTIERMAAACGYEKADLVLHGQEDSDYHEGYVSVVIVHAIEYPVDKDRIKRIMDSDGTSSLVLSDGTSIQIFVLRNGSVDECAELPRKPSRAEAPDDSDMILMKQCRAMVNAITIARARSRRSLNDAGAGEPSFFRERSVPDGTNGWYDDFQFVVLMSVIYDEYGMWPSLESDEYAKLGWGQCVEAAFSTCPWAERLFSKMHIGGAFEAYRSMILGFKDASMSKRSIQLASAYLEISRMMRSDHHPKQTTVSAIELRALRYGRTAVMTMDPAVSYLAYRDDAKDICGNDSFDYWMVRFLANDEIPYTELGWGVESNYETIVCMPPLGVSKIQDLEYENKRGANMETAVLEDAINHVTGGGYVIALISRAVLSNGIFSEFRDWIGSRASIAAVLELKGAIATTGMTCCLLVLQKAARSEAIVSRSAIDLWSRGSCPKIGHDDTMRGRIIDDMMLSLGKKLRYYPLGWEDEGSGPQAGSAEVQRDATIGDLVVSYLDTGAIDGELFQKVDESAFEETWDPEQVLLRVELKNESRSTTPISEYCTVISGTSIPSDRYYPDGSITGVPYVRISDIRDGKIDTTGSKRVSSDESNVFARKGDVVLSIQGTIGKSALSEGSPFIPSSQLVLLRPKEGVDPEKLLGAVRSELFIKQMNSRATGSVIKRVSPKQIPGLGVDL